jgi:hypothetical protein
MVLAGNLGAPCAGNFPHPFAVQSASFLGLRPHFQAGVLDAAAPQAIAMSNGLEVVIGL